MEVMANNEEISEKITSTDSEKGNLDRASVHSSQGMSEVDLAKYYEENAGSLVIDPAYVSSRLIRFITQHLNAGKQRSNSERRSPHVSNFRPTEQKFCGPR